MPTATRRRRVSKTRTVARPARLRPLTREEARDWRAARKAGAEAAAEVLARRARRLAAFRAFAAPSPGVLVAEGDSWFDYPQTDVLEALEDEHRWNVVSVAHLGDRVEDMAYGEGQFAKLERALRKLAESGTTPRAILLSGGGNDVAGAEFSMLLNHRQSTLPPLNAKVVDGVLGERLRSAIVFFASGVTALCSALFTSRIPIVMHGYDRPVPDGRGFLGGQSFLPGPWLEPGFRLKGYSDLAETTSLMAQLIDRFNAELARIAGSPGLEHVRHVDLRGTLSNALEGKVYKRDWANELHPSERGFSAVADRIHRMLTTLS